MRKRGVHWDGVPVPGYSVDDLSTSALQQFRERAAENPTPRIVTEPGGLWLEFPFAREQATGGQIGGAISGAILLHDILYAMAIRV